MQLLLDESLPRQLGRELSGHDVTTVVQQGWAGLKNGDLLCRAAAEGFGALLTGDRGIQHQQNVPALGIGVVVLVACSNRIENLLPLVVKLELARAVRSVLRDCGEARHNQR